MSDSARDASRSCDLLVLIGLRATGKTTIGRALSERCALPFADTDEAIAERVGCPAGVFLRDRGEEAFRSVEEEIVVSLVEHHHGILALGGGAVLSIEARRAVLRRQHESCVAVLHLEADPAELVRRQQAAEAAGPETVRPRLLQEAGSLADEVRLLAERRRSIYVALRDLHVETGRGGAGGLEGSVAVILDRLAMLGLTLTENLG